MNFMHEIRPCIAQMGQRRADGSIDLEHYERRARRKRDAAMQATFAGLAARVRLQWSAARAKSPARAIRLG
jgi:hypothetical protein